LAGLKKLLSLFSGRPDSEQLVERTRDEVSAQYWSELLQLRADGEISLEVAKQIERDTFKFRLAGQPPMLSDAAWQSYLRERAAARERSNLRDSGHK
jgi:hypothetical protein